jgi:hypothetical protein
LECRIAYAFSKILIVNLMSICKKEILNPIKLTEYKNGWIYVFFRNYFTILIPRSPWKLV